MKMGPWSLQIKTCGGGTMIRSSRQLDPRGPWVRVPQLRLGWVRSVGTESGRLGSSIGGFNIRVPPRCVGFMVTARTVGFQIRFFLVKNRKTAVLVESHTTNRPCQYVQIGGFGGHIPNSSIDFATCWTLLTRFERCGLPIWSCD